MEEMNYKLRIRWMVCIKKRKSLKIKKIQRNLIDRTTNDIESRDKRVGIMTTKIKELGEIVMI
jgi:hypothetical protein